MKVSRAAFVGLLLILHLIATGCVRYGADGNANERGNANGSATAKGELRSTPPYSTKEPARYRATMVTAGILSSQSAQSTSEEASQNSTQKSGGESSAEQRMTVARDGARRRVDYELPTGRTVSLLQTPEGDYLLDANKKLYAELTDDADETTPNASSGAASANSAKATRDFSPDELLNKGRAAARYEKLGAEILSGRATTKYRVTPTSITGEASGNVGESLIWIDDELQMPTKQEIVSANGADAARWSMELRDIETNVPAETFEIPAGYRRVALRVLFPSNEGARKR
ncbi:MAG: hypothetical protein ACR2LC_14800 [Pyrinomonadaceae bacterium]